VHHIGDELVLYQQRQGLGNIKGLAIGTCGGKGDRLTQSQIGLQAAQQRHIGG
jgi:hypothetical protein